MQNEILLVGAGQMAVDYAKVLKYIDVPFIVVGRAEQSARKFEEATGKSVITGGVEKWLDNGNKSPDTAIVSVTIDTLSEVTKQLIRTGTKSILVEKPAGLTEAEIREVGACAKEHNAKVYVGYNRRFYSSTRKAMEIIEEDGGVTSFHFEFTEWSHIISDLETDKKIKAEWFLANSSHVIDMAFFLGGKPKEICSYTSGGIDWHPSCSVYAGAGITECGALFSYHANWEAPGRWVVEILTRKHRLIFRPLEKLQVQNIGSVAIAEVELDNKLDIELKPGLYQEVRTFLKGGGNGLPSIEEHIGMLGYYKMINKSSK